MFLLTEHRVLQARVGTLFYCQHPYRNASMLVDRVGTNSGLAPKAQIIMLLLGKIICNISQLTKQFAMEKNRLLRSSNRMQFRQEDWCRRRDSNPRSRD